MNARDLAAADESRLLGAIRDSLEHAPDVDLLETAALAEAMDPMPPGVVERAQDALTYDWRCLTLRQPWATWVALGVKPIENRTRKVKRRGPILIHAGLGFDEDAWGRVGTPRKFPPLRSVPAGAIIAAASITDCHEADGCCSPWGEQGAGIFHWALADVRRLPEPVPCKGALGFWRPDTATLAAVLRQITAVSR